ncbi:MAG TPA: heavy metal-associated domain-containing protein [Candidatus Acidoferrum sp.]
MKQHLGRQSGVQKVDVSLIDGKVDVTPKENGQIDPAQLLKAVYDSGVSVAEMDVTARGKIMKDPRGNFALQVSPKQSFAILPNDLLKSVALLADSPAVVTIRGELYRKPAGKKKADASAPLKLLILEVQKKE